MKAYPNLFSKFRVGKVTFKNRIVMPAMATNFGQDGFVTDQIIDYYEARAKGGVGLIIVENASIDYPRGKDIANELRIDDMKYVAGFNNLVERVHSHGAKIFCQIHQCGNQTTLEHSEGVELISPSGVPCPQCQTQPRELTVPEIKELVQQYVKGAHWAKVAGCDGVEVHGAHGYIIQQFMSPQTNFRHDEYGGTFERRMRFPLEIVKGIREECGDDFIIDFRMSVDEFTENGYHLEEGLEMAKMLVDAGVDMIHASAGCYGAMEKSFETQGHAEGERLYIAEAMKNAVNVPVIAVGNLRTPEICEQALEKKQTDFVACGRTLIADPDWANKAKANKADEIRRCINCLHCLGDRVHPGKAMRCTVNPYCGYEHLYRKIDKTESAKKVMIIGGGPAGMTAAYSAALKGHNVTLFEKDKELGGQLKIACVPPNKDIIKNVALWQIGEMKRQGVTVKTGVEVTKELIETENPDYVILASGSLPFVPRVPGIDKTVSSWDYLYGNLSIEEENIIVLGGGLVGAETAHKLAEEGKNVTVMDMLPEIAATLERTSRTEFMRNLKVLNVKQVVNAIATEITDEGVSYINKKNGRLGFVAGQKVVLSIGQSPVNSLENILEEMDIPYFTVGDASRVSTIAESNRTGFDAGQHIE